MQRLAVAAMGSVVDSGGGDLLSGRNTSKWNNTAIKKQTNQNKAREVNAAAAQLRGLSSLRIDLKVCQTGPK
jgi:hypothetical protein